MAIIQDFSDFPEVLREFARHQILWKEILQYDAPSNEIIESSDAGAKLKSIWDSDKYGWWNWWMRFSTGFECLTKALLLKHQIPIIKKKNLLDKGMGKSQQLKTVAAAKVYEVVKMVEVTSNNNPWLQSEFVNLGIKHVREINTQTLGFCKNKLGDLTRKRVFNSGKEEFLFDAITVLLDIRRNVDAHVFLKSQTGDNIHGDLSDIYIPAINIMLKSF